MTNFDVDTPEAEQAIQ